MEQREKDRLIQEAVLEDIKIERIRQNGKWGRQRHPLPIWYVILGEEFGEVGSAIQKRMGWGKPTDPPNEYEELIHLAAVATAMAEQLREEGRHGKADPASSLFNLTTD